MLRDPGDLLDRPSIGNNTGSNPQRDMIELAEFKCVISSPADSDGDVATGGDHLGLGSVGGEPRAPNAAKHSRVQYASERRDSHQVRSRGPGNGDHVNTPVQ